MQSSRPPSRDARWFPSPPRDAPGERRAALDLVGDVTLQPVVPSHRLFKLGLETVEHQLLRLAAALQHLKATKLLIWAKVQTRTHTHARARKGTLDIGTPIQRVQSPCEQTTRTSSLQK